MNTKNLAQLVRERQAKQKQIRAAMDSHDFPGMLARIRERREIDARISAERRSGRRIMLTGRKPIAH